MTAHLVITPIWLPQPFLFYTTLHTDDDTPWFRREKTCEAFCDRALLGVVEEMEECTCEDGGDVATEGVERGEVCGVDGGAG